MSGLHARKRISCFCSRRNPMESETDRLFMFELIVGNGTISQPPRRPVEYSSRRPSAPSWRTCTIQELLSTTGTFRISNGLDCKKTFVCYLHFQSRILRCAVTRSTVFSMLDLPESRSRLYQRRLLRPRRHCSAFLELYLFFSIASFQIYVMFQNLCTTKKAKKRWTEGP